MVVYPKRNMQQLTCISEFVSCYFKWLVISVLTVVCLSNNVSEIFKLVLAVFTHIIFLRLPYYFSVLQWYKIHNTQEVCLLIYLMELTLILSSCSGVWGLCPVRSCGLWLWMYIVLLVLVLLSSSSYIILQLFFG